METEEHKQERRQARLKARIAMEHAITKGVSYGSLRDLVDAMERASTGWHPDNCACAKCSQPTQYTNKEM